MLSENSNYVCLSLGEVDTWLTTKNTPQRLAGLLH